jgi:hypothetical protein
MRLELTRRFAILGLAGVVSDWVDVPLGRLEQDQRHIDPEPASGDIAMVTARLPGDRDQHGVLMTEAP